MASENSVCINILAFEVDKKRFALGLARPS